ncbi:GerAB/ArcD/ProY family transporter [Paenibacillus qinlingensis]|uniref:GerAB/ArcD/ProY family transporter n=1 Tax=Paenibacillus qinlingensis TaxID=1837343 RepID=UPI001564302E|nr:GerAB/ArcD/ProY family transporter [Paenibacillus qinlingensis]NQX59662.1 GerAB/ArcD/ProY family transporter [Paenibacillus qinlingensis]
MNNRRSILTTGQMSSLLIAVTMGSAIIYIPTPLVGFSGNAAWLSLIGAFGFGALVLACTLYLHHRHGGIGLIDYCGKLIGRIPTIVVMLPIVLMLLFATSAIVTGIGDFFTSSMMPKTPSYIFCSISLLVSALTARAGIVIAARVFVLLVPVMFVFTLAILIIAYPIYDWGRLLPLPDKGIGDLLHGFYVGAGFPFGEVCLFPIFLSFASKDQTNVLYRKLFLAFSLTGVTIVIATICTIVAFGPASAHLSYSLYQLASNIQVNGSNVRIEAIVGIAIIVGSYMKATLYLFALNKLLVRLTSVNNTSAYVYPASLLCTMLSLTLFSGPADFQYQVYTVWPFTVIFVGCTLIFALTVLTWLKGSVSNRQKENET